MKINWIFYSENRIFYENYNGYLVLPEYECNLQEWVNNNTLKDLQLQIIWYLQKIRT